MSEDDKTRVDLRDEGIFQLRRLLKTDQIRCSCSHSWSPSSFLRSDGLLLALVTSETSDLALYHRQPGRAATLKRIPWFQNPRKAVAAVTFDPSGRWLLLAALDGSLYVLPAANTLGIDSEGFAPGPRDSGWASNDLTTFTALNSQYSYSRPTALAWWSDLGNRNRGIVGTETGEVVVVDLENGVLLVVLQGSAGAEGSVRDLRVCRREDRGDEEEEDEDEDDEEDEEERARGVVTLLLTNAAGRQWRLLLERRSRGRVYRLGSARVATLLPSGEVVDPDDEDDNRHKGRNFPPARSRLQGLKQLSVEKLAILRQKLADTRNRSLRGQDGRNSQEDANHDDQGRTDLGTGVTLEVPGTLEPIPEGTFITPQYGRQGQNLFTGFHKESGRLTIHGQDPVTPPLYVHRLPRSTDTVLLTQRLFYVTDRERRSVYLISCRLTESGQNVEDGSQQGFNDEAVVAQFSFHDIGIGTGTETGERIREIYKLTDFTKLEPAGSKSAGSDPKTVLPSKIQDVKMDVPAIDACVVVTDCAVYEISLRKPLIEVFMEMVLKKKKPEKASRLTLVFGLNVQLLLEYAGDILLTNREFHRAAILYSLSRCRLLKNVLKFAATGYTAELLGFLAKYLASPTAMELPTATRIHLSNLCVLAFIEMSLRVATTSQRSNYVLKDFLFFLSTNSFYDELLAVNIAGQTCLWKVLHHLGTQRGLNSQILDVLVKSTQNYLSSDSRHLPYGLLICLSEPGLVQAILTKPAAARKHMDFILACLPTLQVFVLQRLITLYDPTSAAVRPLLVRCKARLRTTSRSSQCSSQYDSLDLIETIEETNVVLESLVEVFILVLLTLIHKKCRFVKRNSALMQFVQNPRTARRAESEATGNVDFRRRPLSAGFAHVALIRNRSVYTWGSAAQGCLGTGPSVLRYGPPQGLSLFRAMEIEVLSVSCGRCHTLAVTNNGVYAWGGSQFGQLGLGKTLQSPNPEIVASLSQEVIVDAVAGQYHSLALTADGRVFSWGWGAYGQLGHGNTDEKSLPTLISSLLGTVVRQISAGHAHTLLLSSEGVVFAFGCNVFGQLGTGDHLKSSLPRKVALPTLERICMIATGYFHNLAVSQNNKLYTWGSSPQVLRLQAQAQKRSRLQEVQEANLEQGKRGWKAKDGRRNLSRSDRESPGAGKIREETRTLGESGNYFSSGQQSSRSLQEIPKEGRNEGEGREGIFTRTDSDASEAGKIREAEGTSEKSGNNFSSASESSRSLQEISNEGNLREKEGDSRKWNLSQKSGGILEGGKMMEERGNVEERGKYFSEVPEGSRNLRENHEAERSRVSREIPGKIDSEGPRTAGKNFRTAGNSRSSSTESNDNDNCNNNSNNNNNNSNLNSRSMKGVNVGSLEENLTHLQPVLVDSSLVRGQIVQISTGCHHSALLTRDGTVYTWGRNLDGQVGNGSRREVPIPTPLYFNPDSALGQIPPRHSKIHKGRDQVPDMDNTQGEANEETDPFRGGKSDNEEKSRENLNEERFQERSRVIKAIRVACGCDYTVAIQPGGSVLGWGNNHLSQLGCPPAKDSRGNDEKLVLLKSSKRIVRLPYTVHNSMECPSQVPDIPSPVITYESYDITPLAGVVKPLSVIEKSPSELTLHYVLEHFHGLYEPQKIVDKCLGLKNHQAAAKVAVLQHNYSEGFSLELESLGSSGNSAPFETRRPRSSKTPSDSSSSRRSIERNIELFDRQVERNFLETLEFGAAKKKLKMPVSKSLDSFDPRPEEEDLFTFDLQGGSEELCDEDDSRLDSKVDLERRERERERERGQEQGEDERRRVRDKNLLNCSEEHLENSELFQLQEPVPKLPQELTESQTSLMTEAGNVLRFYLGEVEEDANETLLEIIRRSVAFWSGNRLPVATLESVYEEFLNKVYYALGLFLFCDSGNEKMDANKNEDTSSNSKAMKIFSTNFYLRVCSMLLEHVDRRKPAPEFIKLFSLLTACEYGPPLTGFPGSRGNETPEQMVQGIISTISSKNCDPRPYIHIKDANSVSSFLSAEKEDLMVFSCGHHFPFASYQSDVIPTMEAELLMAQPLSLPCTAQVLADILSETHNPETICPLCIPGVLESEVKAITNR